MKDEPGEKSSEMKTLQPSFPNARLNLGILFESRGYLADAVDQFEALVREAKAIVLDELTGEGGAGEETVPAEVRISRRHFEAALDRIRGTLDGTDFERYEQKAWDLLYAKGKREILYQAVGLINQVEYLKGKHALNDGILQQADELRDLVYWQRKSFDEIRERTAALRKALEAGTG